MSVELTYDLDSGTCSPLERNRLRSLLERFGWVLAGGSVYRYEADEGQKEDWLNEIAPSLMLFRSFVVCHDIAVTRFTIKVNSDVAADDTSSLHPRPITASDLYEPENKAFGGSNLAKWVLRIDRACPYPLD